MRTALRIRDERDEVVAGPLALTDAHMRTADWAGLATFEDKDSATMGSSHFTVGWDDATSGGQTAV